MRYSILFPAILLSVGSFCTIKAFSLSNLRSTYLPIPSSSIEANDVSAVLHRVAHEKHSEQARVETETPSLPPNWLIIPFLLLLGMIATGPLLYAHFWHRYYPTLSILLASFVVLYYVLILHDFVNPLSTIIEYVQFIALIGALYMAAGGILIKIDRVASPTLNLGILFSGAILSNLIGTTGASMLLIRPYIRLNQPHIQIYHIIFFIFNRQLFPTPTLPQNTMISWMGIGVDPLPVTGSAGIGIENCLLSAEQLLKKLAASSK